MTELSCVVLDRIRFVMVETTHPGNIGAVARAMKTMGLSRLHLVRPKSFPNAEAVARASGADDLLAIAQSHGELPDALRGCRLVMGASARLRTLEWPLLEPGECARRLLAEAHEGDVALVLGRESSGLTNDELAHCHFLAHIPSSPTFSSLNVASAAQIFAYEIRRTWREVEGLRIEDKGWDPAPAEAMEGFFTHLAQALVDTGFSDPKQSRKLIRRLRRLFNRARPDMTELNILRGILSAAQGEKAPERFGRSGQPSPTQSPTLAALSAGRHDK
jgi:tRNA (cytidine32/uridine32-2'-O)-methyltransferase